MSATTRYADCSHGVTPTLRVTTRTYPAKCVCCGEPFNPYDVTAPSMVRCRQCGPGPLWGDITV